MEEPQTAVFPLLKSISVVYWCTLLGKWMCTWCYHWSCNVNCDSLLGNYCLSLLLCKHRHIHIKLNPVISSDPVQPQGHAAIELLIVGSCHLSPCIYTGYVSFLLCIVYGFPGVCVSCGRVCRCALASRSKGLTETVALWSEEVGQRQR